MKQPQEDNEATQHTETMMIETLETEVSELLEAKKTEVTFTAGCARGTQECAKSHAEFVEKSRVELQTLVTENNLSIEVANFALSWLSKSQKFVFDYATMMKTSSDVRSGEALALDGMKKKIKALRASTERKSVEPEEAKTEEVLTAVSSEESSKVEASSEVSEQTTKASTTVETKTKKKRPDERGEAAKTVKRLKEARQKRAAEKSQ